MSNGDTPQQPPELDDFEDVPEVPEVPKVPSIPASPPPLPAAAPDIALFERESQATAADISDADDRVSLAEIQVHTSRFGRRAAAALAITGLAIAGYAYWTHTRSEAAAARMDEISQMTDQAQMLAALRELLAETRNPDVQIRIMMNLGHFKDPQAVPLLVEKLSTAGPVRRAAAWALGQIGLPGAESAKPALLAVLPEVDARDEAQVIWTLALLREQGASDALVEAFAAGKLQNLDGFSPRIIVEVLGPERLSSDALITHPEEAVRVLTAHALAETTSAAAVDPLTRMLNAELAREPEARSREVIRAAAAGLGRSGDARAAAPLFSVLQNQPNLRQPVLEALEQSTGAPDLAILLREARDEGIRLDLVRLIAGSHDARAADTLAGLLEDANAEIRQTAAFALAELGDARAMDALFVITGDQENRTLAADAIDAIAKIANPSATARLVELLRTSPRKASILRALGKTGDPSAARAIEGELEGDDGPSAARALADLGDDAAYRRLLALVVRPRNVSMGALTMADRDISNEDLIRRRKVAIMAMGQYRRADALEPLMRVVEDGEDDFELRAIAAASIGQIANAEQMITIFGKLQDASLSEASRRYYVQALWQEPHAELNDRLLTLMASPTAGQDVARAAALAVGYAADPVNDIRLMEMLDGDATQRGAAFAIVLGAGPDAVQKLMQKLATGTELRDAMMEYVGTDQYDWFALITENMFQTEAIWRRIRAARQLKEGDGETSYGYVWNNVLQILQSGMDRPGGASPRFIREQLWQALHHADEQRRLTAAQILEEMGERGLLLRARDEGGPAGDTARAIIQAAEAPPSS